MNSRKATDDRPLTYGEAVTRLCRLRDELRATEYGRFVLAGIITELKRFSEKGGERK